MPRMTVQTGLNPPKQTKVAAETDKCPECDTVFRRVRRSGGRVQVYCSVRCRMRASRRNRLTATPPCDVCGKVVLRPPSGIAHATKNHFCSTTCHGKWMSENLRGEAHPNWKGLRGLTNIIRSRLAANPRWAAWAAEVLA